VVVARPVVGVDIDGVLGDQVSGVLARVNARLGLSLAYDDIVHWDVPLGDTSFVPEIREAMKDPAYVRGMPVHDGAAALLEELKGIYHVKLLTVRPAEAIQATEQWLADNGLVFDELAQAEEAKKSLHEVDALIDDYVGNLADFLENGRGPAILVDQPWNQDISALNLWRGDARLIQVDKLADVPGLLREAFG
jgi:5'(3')-deoxyribonucleotidase